GQLAQQFVSRVEVRICTRPHPSPQRNHVLRTQVLEISNRRREDDVRIVEPDGHPVMRKAAALRVLPELDSAGRRGREVCGPAIASMQEAPPAKAAPTPAARRRTRRSWKLSPHLSWR